MNGSGWDAAPAIAALEADLGLPVLWPQAMYTWAVYRRLAISNQRPDLGHLIAQWPALTQH